MKINQSIRATRFLLKLAGLMVVLAGTAWLLLPKPTLLDEVSFSRRVYDREGGLLRMTLSDDDKYRVFIPLRDIAPSMVEATLLHEDRYFHDHCGMNPVSLARAAWNSYLGGGRRFGASTITMQLARIRFHLHTRTWGGKLVQIFRAFQLERHYTKEEILEAYFNLAPYGRNMEGVGAASLVYYGRSPDRLTLPEALTLGVIPQSPLRRAPSNRAENHALIESRKILRAQWIERHPESRETLAALDLPFRASAKETLPFHAPHFVDDILQERNTSSEIRTTLDPRLQQLVERRLAAHLESHGKDGLHNASALLVDSRTMEVLAEVGSADYFDKNIDGAINGTRVKRSPGSALKPFIYALAIEQGLIHPHSLLKDGPSSFAEYNPENFDGKFVGPIHATDALIQSRNVPAVFLESQLTGRNLHTLLHEAGVRGLRDESFYGLTIALGSAEVTMEEMAVLYGALANRGMIRPVSRRVPAQREEPRRLLSPEAAWLTRMMLEKSQRPDGMDAKGWTRGATPVAWKTVTSFSFRDAWTAGIFGHYVLVVWVGNFDGKGNPSFVGRSAAAPLFFQIEEAVSAMSSPLTAQGGERDGLNVREVDLCEAGGHLAGPHCPRVIKGWFIPGVSPIKTCDVHREVPVDARTGRRVWDGQNADQAKVEIHEFWPSDMLELFKQAGVPRKSVPAFEPGCPLERLENDATSVKITSPGHDTTYVLRASQEGRDTLALKAATSAESRKVFWFSDHSFLGTTAAGETFYWKGTPGRHTIRAMDERGGSDSRDITLTVLE